MPAHFRRRSRWVLVTARSDTLGDAPVPEFAAILSKPVTAARLARTVRYASARGSIVDG